MKVNLPTLVELMRKNTARNLAKAEYMIVEGFNINEKDDNHWTPLHYAVLHNRRSAVSYFIQRGADINARTADSLRTPLHIAAEQGQYSVARELIAVGADVQAIDREWNTPLALAFKNRHLKTAGFLRKMESYDNYTVLRDRNQD
jgi:ankyrin repeat protein